MPESSRGSNGRVFAGRFVVKSRIAKGSMGSVYLVTQMSDQKTYALKVIRPEALRAEKGRRRFEREADAGLRLTHPGIVRTYEAGKDSATGEHFLLMEHVEGQTLDDFVGERWSLPPAQRAGLMHQLLDILAYAHNQGIVHRDLKPDNLLMESGPEGDRLRVLDFGIAKDLQSATAQRTAAGLGTPLWTAPDQGITGATPSKRWDLWALGLLGFFLMSGRIYWKSAAERASIVDLSLELLQSEIVPASERAKELGVTEALPPGFDAWFRRCVNRDPEARFADAGEAKQAFEAMGGGNAAKGPARWVAVAMAVCLVAGLAALAIAKLSG